MSDWARWGKSRISPLQALHTAANGFLRLETLREANDRVSDAVAELHSSLQYWRRDPLVERRTENEDAVPYHSVASFAKIFRLKKGITQYTLVANHVPVNARLWRQRAREPLRIRRAVRTRRIQPTVHSTDTHSTNEVNFTILSVFGYQFAPLSEIQSKTDTLYGFKHSNKYDEKFLLKPASKVNTQLVIDESDNIQHILASLALKVAGRHTYRQAERLCPGKIARKKPCGSLENIYRSLYLLARQFGDVFFAATSNAR